MVTSQSKELMSTSCDMTARIWNDELDERARFLNSRVGGLKVFGRHKEFVIGSDYSLWGEPGWVATRDGMKWFIYGTLNDYKFDAMACLRKFCIFLYLHRKVIGI